MKRNVDIYLCGDCNKLVIIVSQLDSILYSRSKKIAPKKIVVSYCHHSIEAVLGIFECKSVIYSVFQAFALLARLEDPAVNALLNTRY